MEGREKRRRAEAEAGEQPPQPQEEAETDDDDEARLLLRRIKRLVRRLVSAVSCSRSPSLALPRYQNYCASSAPSPSSCACSYDRPVGNDALSLLHKGSHASRLNVILRVLCVVQQLLQQNKHCSKRDVYYMYPSVFLEQAVVDRAINDICILLKCSRHNLNVVPVGKGLVMGWIRFIEGDNKVCCITNLNVAFPIPVSVEAIKDVVSVAHYILVVEKETVFQRLANDKFCERNLCIVITQLAYDAKFLRVPEIRWLGVFASDCEEYCIPDCCLLHLTAEDRRKAEAILTRCYLHREAPEWRLELEVMLKKGIKFEIEALSASSISFLSEEYIPHRILQGRHI